MHFPIDGGTRAHLGKYKYDSLTIDCGEYTYGRPEIMVTPVDRSRTLRIGRYCSIARECLIYVGRHGRHPLQTLTSFPITMSVSPEKRKGVVFKSQIDKPNLDVIIGNDVWIGGRCTIFAGVTIGDGAVLGFGSIVTRDVEPYSIVGGNPARHIRFRHEADVRARLLESAWWEYEPDELFEILGEHLTSQDMDLVLKKLAIARMSAAAVQ